MNGETGATVRSAIDALKGSPFLLGLLVLNCVFMGAIFFAIREQRAQQHELNQASLAQIDKLIGMVADCHK